jgi:hypothetical protein
MSRFRVLVRVRVVLVLSRFCVLAVYIYTSLAAFCNIASNTEKNREIKKKKNGCDTRPWRYIFSPCVSV